MNGPGLQKMEVKLFFTPGIEHAAYSLYQGIQGPACTAQAFHDRIQAALHSERIFPFVMVSAYLHPDKYSVCISFLDHDIG